MLVGMRSEIASIPAPSKYPYLGRFISATCDYVVLFNRPNRGTVVQVTKALGALYQPSLGDDEQAYAEGDFQRLEGQVVLSN